MGINSTLSSLKTSENFSFLVRFLMFSGKFELIYLNPLKFQVKFGEKR